MCVGGSTLVLTVSVFLVGAAKPAEAIAIFPYTEIKISNAERNICDSMK